MDTADVEFMVKRLRVVVDLLGLTDAVPSDNKTIAGAAGTVLGMVARHIENLLDENASMKTAAQKTATLMCLWKTGQIDGDTLAGRLFSIAASEPVHK